MRNAVKRVIVALVVVALLPLLPACAPTTTDYMDEFSSGEVLTIDISFSDGGWESILENPENEEYYSADVTINGLTVENSGVRTKGNISLNTVAHSDSDRYSLRIKFDKYVDEQKYKDLDELVLNNMYQDPSYMREYLHYEALREAGATVPHAAYANVTVNGQPYGLFLAVEAADNSFLKNQVDPMYKIGNFYQMNEGATLMVEEDEVYSYAELKKGDDNTKVGLRNFIKVLNEMPTGQKGDIESVLDVDSALVYIAGNTVMGNYDSYNGNRHHNYYLYESPDGVFSVIPWDFNMSFAGFGGGNLTGIDIDAPVLSGDASGLPLISKLLSVPEYYEKYKAYIEGFCEYFADFETRVNTLAEKIRPYVESDPTKFYTMEEFEAAIASDGELGGLAPEGEGRQRPEGFGGGQRPEGLAGERPEGFGANRGMGGAGGQLTQSGISIVVYMNARLENLRTQLAE